MAWPVLESKIPASLLRCSTTEPLGWISTQSSLNYHICIVSTGSNIPLAMRDFFSEYYSPQSHTPLCLHSLPGTRKRLGSEEDPSSKGPFQNTPNLCSSHVCLLYRQEYHNTKHLYFPKHRLYMYMYFQNRQLSMTIFNFWAYIPRRRKHAQYL